MLSDCEALYLGRVLRFAVLNWSIYIGSYLLVTIRELRKLSKYRSSRHFRSVGNRWFEFFFILKVISRSLLDVKLKACLKEAAIENIQSYTLTNPLPRKTISVQRNIPVQCRPEFMSYKPRIMVAGIRKLYTAGEFEVSGKKTQIFGNRVELFSGCVRTFQRDTFKLNDRCVRMFWQVKKNRTLTGGFKLF